MGAHTKHLDDNWARGAYRCTTLPSGHTSSVRALALDSASGALFSGASDRKVKLWALRQRARSGSAPPPPPPATARAYASAGTLTGPNAGVVTIRLQADAGSAELTVGFRNGVVKTWACADAGGGAGEWKVRCERQLAAIAEGFVFGAAATLLWDDSVCALDSETGAVLGAFTAHTKKVTCVDFLPGTRGTAALSSSLDKTMRVWDTRTSVGPGSAADAGGGGAGAGAGAVVLRGHTAGVNSFALLSDSVVASAANDRSVRLWDLRHPAAPLATLLGHVSPVRCVVCDRRRRVLLSGSDDHSVRLWSAQTFSLVARYEEHAAPVTCLAADDVFLVSASSDGVVRVSDFAADLL